MAPISKWLEEEDDIVATGSGRVLMGGATLGLEVVDDEELSADKRQELAIKGIELLGESWESGGGRFKANLLRR